MYFTGSNLKCNLKCNLCIWTETIFKVWKPIKINVNWYLFKVLCKKNLFVILSFIEKYHQNWNQCQQYLQEHYTSSKSFKMFFHVTCLKVILLLIGTLLLTKNCFNLNNIKQICNMNNVLKLTMNFFFNKITIKTNWNKLIT